MRNSTDDKQAGGERNVLSKRHVYWTPTNQKELRHIRKETTTQMFRLREQPRLTDLLVRHRSPQVGVFI